MSESIKIKVCGMRQEQNIYEIARLRPDYMGFIFYPDSPRYAGDTLTPAITAKIPDTIHTTGVFVNAPTSWIESICKKFTLNTVQLHGKESPEQCRELQEKGYEVIKTFSLTKKEDLRNTRNYRSYCDFFLFDTPTYKYGGSGKKFDWSVLEHFEADRPFFLSGGIEARDAPTIINETPLQPYALDINSRFETHPGEKDTQMVDRFIKHIRALER